MTTRSKLLALASALSALAAHQVSAIVVGTDIGTANPPGTLGGYTMSSYNPGSIGGATPLTIGSGWATWGQGYTGTVYASFSSDPLTLSLSSGTKAVYFYMEPNRFSDFYMTATDASGVSVTTLINGRAGSAGVGFHVTEAAESLVSIVVTATDDTGFAIGNFGINGGTLTGTVGAVPDAGSTLAMLVLALGAVVGLRRKL